ncbi:putative Clusterin-associated protein [Blattamonas nauphoetae]|uniref:Clusterin-associated protein n=1 Tax=Blattamonas nauphoetae TaxID=2049346 RepID=A0ABQ9Y159_9EUKA|nr:putative Clusterin-associated protein [Blattamonas nauphoetae]
MKQLGYPNLISYASFRQPNFELVSHSLYWLIKRADPNFMYPYEIDTDNDRVALTKAMANHATTHLHIKINPKTVYQADQASVHELFKISKILGEASRLKPGTAMSSMDIPPPSETKETRTLASEITQDGAKLSEFLLAEKELKGSRLSALSVPMEPELAEKLLEDKIQQNKDEAKRQKERLHELERDKASLTDRIVKKKEELERCKNRLQAWKAVKPAHLEEFDRVEQELRTLHQTYVAQYENLMYLEREMDAVYAKEREKYQSVERHLSKMQRKMVGPRGSYGDRNMSASDDLTDEEETNTSDEVSDHESSDFRGPRTNTNRRPFNDTETETGDDDDTDVGSTDDGDDSDDGTEEEYEETEDEEPEYRRRR